MNTLRALSAVLIALSTAQGGAFPTRIEPVDEGSKSASFAKFRTELLQAVATRDIAAVLQAMDQGVTVTPGNRVGIPQLKRVWKVDRSPDALLKEVGLIFSLGGRLVSPTGFVAPYPFTEFPDPPAGQSVMSYTVVVKPGTKVFSRPDPKSGVIGTVNDELLKYNDTPQGWRTVWMPDGRTGYVKADATRSPADTHAIVALKNDRWRIVEFSASIE